MKLSLDTFMEDMRNRNPGEREFLQAVEEVAATLIPFVNENPKYLESRILTRMTEPDRIISFRVCWEDDQGLIRINRGYRVQFNNSIGPYKGGLRFHPSVNQSILKFLGFEQIFKNSLTTLPLGGGKGGANFNPKGKSDREIERFCQSFMTELSRHIGPHVDVPAGDIGVGALEIGFMFGQYKRLANEFSGILTGKSLSTGGSLIRTEATGYGTVYFARNMLAWAGDDIEGKTAVVSGSGNVAQYATEKLMQFGAKVLTLSDSSGFIYDPDGVTQEKLDWVKELKATRRGRIREYAEEFGCEYFADQRPWSIAADLAFPCATQNELDDSDAQALVKNGCKLVSEGANMPCTPEAVKIFQNAGVLYGPGKAANAGGVAVSGLEMSQNSMRLSWTREELDERLRTIMKTIHDQCVMYGRSGLEVSGGEGGDPVDYVKGANIAGFKKVADAMISFGVV